ncbi:MAG: hypothetical protein ACK58N_00220 [Synechocystis sp.]
MIEGFLNLDLPETGIEPLFYDRLFQQALTITQRKAGLKENVELAQKAEVQKLWKRSIRIFVQVIVIGTNCILVFLKTRKIGMELL